MDNLPYTQGYGWTQGFDWSQFEDDSAARTTAILMSVVFVFLLMGVLFESFVLPLSVITTIPMAMIGVYWTLFLTGDSIDMMAGIGLIVLVGIVVNNGIVLVDLVTKLRREGMCRTDALIEAGARRMRPILMTALTTIVGLLPMSLGNATFVGTPYAPLGRVVAGGLAVGTVLTLFFVPYLYSIIDDTRDSSHRWLDWVRGNRATKEYKEES